MTIKRGGQPGVKSSERADSDVQRVEIRVDGFHTYPLLHGFLYDLFVIDCADRRIRTGAVASDDLPTWFLVDESK